MFIITELDEWSTYDGTVKYAFCAIPVPPTPPPYFPNFCESVPASFALISDVGV